MKYEPLISQQYYHIYNRGNNGEDIFREEENYYYFLDLSKKHIVPVAHILSYCLLKNHFHLLINTKNLEDKKIAQGFSNLFNAYAKAINKKYNRNGSLFQRKFQRKRIDSEDYLRKLIVYINLNSTIHGFCEDYKDYRHSSYQGLVSYKPTALERQFVIDLFEDRENMKYAFDTKKYEIDNKDYYLE